MHPLHSAQFLRDIPYYASNIVSSLSLFPIYSALIMKLILSSNKNCLDRRGIEPLQIAGSGNQKPDMRHLGILKTQQDIKFHKYFGNQSLFINNPLWICISLYGSPKCYIFMSSKIDFDCFCKCNFFC